MFETVIPYFNRLKTPFNQLRSCISPRKTLIHLEKLSNYNVRSNNAR